MNFSKWLEANESAPWSRNGIGTNKLLPHLPVIMMPIGDIKPVHQTRQNNRPSKPIVDPAAPYEPLIVDTRGELQDGYHRYFNLLDAGYKGKVPVVVYS